MVGARRRKRRLYCDCSGRCGNQPGNTLPTNPRNCRSDGIPIAACATANATSSASVTLPGGPRRGIAAPSANMYAATTRVSSDAVISCSNHEETGLEALSSCTHRVPAHETHIKPLDGDDSVEGHHAPATPTTDGSLGGDARAARRGQVVVVHPGVPRRVGRRLPLRRRVDGRAGTDPSGPGAYLLPCEIGVRRFP